MDKIYECLKSFFGNPIVSVFIGGGVTWLFSWLYYKKAGDELKSEASRMHRTTELILRWLEVRGEGVSVIRQSDGIPKSLAHTASVSESGNATSTSDATVIRGENTDCP